MFICPQRLRTVWETQTNDEKIYLLSQTLLSEKPKQIVCPKKGFTYN